MDRTLTTDRSTHADQPVDLEIIMLRYVLFPMFWFLMSYSLCNAQSYPVRPVTIVVPYTAGSGPDVEARLVSGKFSEALGVPVVVENRTGAAGNIGTAYVAKSKPDGYTILTAAISLLSINEWLYKSLPYDMENDFAPVTNIGTFTNTIVISPDVKASNLKELIALAKAKPGSLFFGSSGAGTTHHMCGEMFKSSSGIDIMHSPYRGSPEALQDLMTGRIQIMCSNTMSIVSHVKAGKLRPIAVTTRTRDPFLPDVPTMEEAGMPGFEVTAWVGFAVPAATPKTIVQRINRDMVKAIRDPAVTQRLTTLGVTVIADSPEEFSSFIAAESAKWKKVVSDARVQID